MSLAVITALMLMSLCAVSVSLLVLHVTSALTLMSPLSLPLSASEVMMWTLLSSNASESFSAPIPLTVCVPSPASIVKSVGSISHVPVAPDVAAVVISASSANLTLAALVSMKPPLPPLVADASSVPPT